MTEPLTPEELDRYRAMLSDPVTRAHMDRASLLRAADAFLATLDGASEGLDVERLAAALIQTGVYIDDELPSPRDFAAIIAREYAALASQSEETTDAHD